MVPDIEFLVLSCSAVLVVRTDIVLLVGRVMRAGTGSPLMIWLEVLTINIRVAAFGSANGKSKQLNKRFP